jgi:putative ABC transport system permease protein
MDQLEAELTGMMRSRRGLRPIEEDNFSINRAEMIMTAVEGVFSVLTIAGWVIGSFSILVGGFGIANIMFVSVKERTNIIGIQKSLGAKNYFILFQFLFEAVFLSILGGGAGLLIVYLITFIPFGSLEVVLTAKNIMIGLGVSSIIGILSGIIPAAAAARLDPVIAIRSK